MKQGEQRCNEGKAVKEETIQVLTSQTKAYHDAFKIFLDHTDQKIQARKRLAELVATLDSRETFIDSGAGNGQTTAWLADDFEKTIAVEPNPSLREELIKNCPSADIIGEPIRTANISNLADFILCSHVFYYVGRNDWINNLETLASWLSPTGLLVLILQNENTDCMTMNDHFYGRRFKLGSLADEFRAKYGKQYQIQLETVPAHVVTHDFASAFKVAEFMLNLLPNTVPPTRVAVEHYVRDKFAKDDGTYQFSCHQDFLKIQQRIDLT